MQALIGHDLVDELRLMIDPILLGDGKRPFPQDGISSAMCGDALDSAHGARGSLTSRVSRKHIPDVPIDPVLSRDFGLGLFEPALGALVGDPFNNCKRVQVAEPS